MVRVQLERIKAALRQVLRAGSGRDVSATELRNRASAYTDPSIPRVPLLVTETNLDDDIRRHSKVCSP